MDALTKDEIYALVAAAAAAADQAYAPYSEYRVGAALLDEEGATHAGCNVENIAYGLTICAERNALFSAVAAGQRKFAALAIAADGDLPPYPCGACRQVLAEFCSPRFPIYIVCAREPEKRVCVSLGELLPHAFGGTRSE